MFTIGDFEEPRGMLRLRRAELETAVVEARARPER